jgi:prolyl oligopeptidase PreP (S9A serine peptidase family)
MQLEATHGEAAVAVSHAARVPAPENRVADVARTSYLEVTEGGHDAGANIKEGSMSSALEYTYFTRRLIEGAAR